jgi:hypothetical protein
MAETKVIHRQFKQLVQLALRKCVKLNPVHHKLFFFKDLFE